MDKILLNDALCEQSVLATMLLYNEHYRAYDGFIGVGMFYSPKNARLFEVMAHIIDDDGKEADIVSVTGYYTANASASNYTPEELIELSNLASVGAFRQNIDRLRELENRRKCWLIGQRLIAVGTDAGMDYHEAKSEASDGLKALDEDADTGIITMRDALEELGGIVERNKDLSTPSGSMTDFRFIDVTGGLHNGDLDIIAAESSQGKTSLAVSLAVNTAMKGNGVAYYSMEMRSTQLAARIISGKTGIPSSTILYAPLSESQEAAYGRGVTKVGDLPFYFDDRSTLSIERILSSIRKMKRKQDIKLAVVDYLQILSSTEKFRDEEKFMGKVARRLKNIAKELDICVIALSQLSRDKENPEPRVSRIRASGQINEAADTVMLIYRPEYYGRNYSKPFEGESTAGTAQITIAKGRNIGTGATIVGFDKEKCLFYDRNNYNPAAEEWQDTPF